MNKLFKADWSVVVQLGFGSFFMKQYNDLVISIFGDLTICYPFVEEVTQFFYECLYFIFYHFTFTQSVEQFLWCYLRYFLDPISIETTQTYYTKISYKMCQLQPYISNVMPLLENCKIMPANDDVDMTVVSPSSSSLFVYFTSILEYAIIMQILNA